MFAQGLQRMPESSVLLPTTAQDVAGEFWQATGHGVTATTADWQLDHRAAILPSSAQDVTLSVFDLHNKLVQVLTAALDDNGRPQRPRSHVSFGTLKCERGHLRAKYSPVNTVK